MKTRVMIVEQQSILRCGVRLILGQEKDIEVVSESHNGRNALQMLSKIQAQIVVMNVDMPELNGVEATRQIKATWPRVKVIIFSDVPTQAVLAKLLDTSISGFVLKSDEPKTLLQAIREVSGGNSFFSPSITAQLIEVRKYNGFEPYLTSREAEILQLIAESHPNKTIAANLNISVKTVEKHRQGVMNKLGIHSAVGLTRHYLTSMSPVSQ